MRTALVGVLLLAAAGCGIEHRSEAYGRAYRESMAMQVKPPAVPPAPTNMSLDTQEAGVVSGTYLHGLAGKGSQTTAAEEPVLYVAPAGRQGSNQLPPSVPKD